MMIDEKYVEQRKIELQENITMRNDDIKLLLDFATGYKKLPDQNFRRIPYQKNNMRLVSTIGQLHRQIRELEKEYSLLAKMLIKDKEKAS